MILGLLISILSATYTITSSSSVEESGNMPEEIAAASPADMNIYYSAERQALYGVVGIEIALLEDAI